MSQKKILLKGEEVKAEHKKQHVSVKGVVANSDGYYKGQIIKAGQKFDYDGLARNDGSLPLWVDAPENYKPKKAVKVVHVNDVKEGQVLDEDSVDEVIPADGASVSSKVGAKLHNAGKTIKNAVSDLV